MSNVKIFPIFNQSAPGVWDDFLRIRVAAMKHNYDIQLSDYALKNALDELQQTKHPFAFGAYDDDKMVGCIHGSIQPNTAEINHLYVLPEYQGQKIGIKLLQSAEAAISLNTNNAVLISLGKACKFYEKHGYTSPEWTNKFCKNVKNSGNCRVSPVFVPSASLIRQLAKISNKPTTLFDKKKLSAERTPIFVYRNLDSKICGFAIAGDIPLVYTTSGWSPLQLNNTIKKYQEFMNSR